jgi:hypothetical protein
MYAPYGHPGIGIIQGARQGQHSTEDRYQSIGARARQVDRGITKEEGTTFASMLEDSLYKLTPEGTLVHEEPNVTVLLENAEHDPQGEPPTLIMHAYLRMRRDGQYGLTSAATLDFSQFEEDWNRLSDFRISSEAFYNQDGTLEWTLEPATTADRARDHPRSVEDSEEFYNVRPEIRSLVGDATDAASRTGGSFIKTDASGDLTRTRVALYWKFEKTEEPTHNVPSGSALSSPSIE